MKKEIKIVIALGVGYIVVDWIRIRRYITYLEGWKKGVSNGMDLMTDTEKKEA